MRVWRLLTVALVLLVAGYAWRHRQPGTSPSQATNRTAAAQATGTAGSQAKPRSMPAAGSSIAVARDGTVTIPLRFRLPGVGWARSASNFRDWLAQYPPYQQAKISNFSERHFGVYRVNSREQVAWMAQNGYPMPEDVIAAEGLSDAALLEMASQGNDKAGFLLKERNDAKLAAYLARGGKRGDFFSGPEGTRRLQENSRLEQLMDQSNSPYKGYVQANEAMSGIYYADQESVDTQVIAGLLWANSLGDTRALPFAVEFARNDSSRRLMLSAALAVSNNDSVSMRHMAETGGQRPGAPSGMWIPDNSTPVN